jgi:FSR family fosmidomycin resistance protein-like MFS transporter
MMTKIYRNPLLWLLSLSHFCTDLYSGALSIVMVDVSRQLGLSVSQFAFTLTTFSLASSLSQPIFGYIGDKFGGKWFVAGGVFVIATFLALMGFVNTWGMVVFCIVMAGLGSAAFHPQGASGASMAGGAQKSTAISIFMLGGNMGYAMGPLLASLIVPLAGRQSIGFVSIFGVLMAPLIYKLLTAQNVVAKPRVMSKGIARNSAFSGFAIFALLAIMALRAGAQSSINALTPKFFGDELGMGIGFAGTLASVQLFALAVGGIAGGYMADRFGSRLIIFFSLIVCVPLTALFFLTHNSWVLLVGAIMGFFFGMSWPPLLALSQELFPKSAGLASGLSLGFVFAMGGVGTSITGFLSEPSNLGMQQALLLLSPWSLVAALFVLALPGKDKIIAASKSLTSPSVQKTA